MLGYGVAVLLTVLLAEYVASALDEDGLLCEVET